MQIRQWPAAGILIMGPAGDHSRVIGAKHRRRIQKLPAMLLAQVLQMLPQARIGRHAARAMQAEGRARRILIVDCDVHQGNGTASILAGDDSIFTFSIHGARNFPFAKEQSDLDIELPDGYFHFLPIINWGSYKKENGKILMPLTVRLNHAAADGYLISKVFTMLEDEIQKLREKI